MDAFTTKLIEIGIDVDLNKDTSDITQY